MADEPKRTSRSTSTGATRKGRTKATAAAASGKETAAEKPAAEKPAAEQSAAETAAASEAKAAASEAKAAASEAKAAASEAKAAAAKPAPQPAPAPHPAPAAESSGSGSGVALAGLIAGVVGIVLALTYPQWTPIVYGSSGSEQRVTADQVRTELKGEVEALKATIAAMSEKEAALEKAVQTAKIPGILMVAEDLRTALGGSEPYAGPLNLFRSLTGGDAAAAPIVAAIEARAEVGVPTVEEVQESFDEVAHAILMAEQRPTASGDLAAQMSDTVASLAAATMRLRWRIDGAPTGEGVPAVVARAEQAVMGGELQTAIDTLGTLPEGRAALAASWIESVKARMQADTVREDLDAYIISMAARVQ
jgi:hypothetical protein